MAAIATTVPQFELQGSDVSVRISSKFRPHPYFPLEPAA